MRFSDLPKKTLKALIVAYSYIISPLTGPNCRFHPTCSHYALESVERHGVLKGGVLAAIRIARCHPWHKSEMLDPVPASIDWPAIISYKRPNAKEPRSCGCTNHHMKE